MFMKRRHAKEMHGIEMKSKQDEKQTYLSAISTGPRVCGYLATFLAESYSEPVIVLMLMGATAPLAVASRRTPAAEEEEDDEGGAPVIGSAHGRNIFSPRISSGTNLP